VIDSKYVNECFEYDRLTGNLIWKRRPLHHFSSEKGMRTSNGRSAGKVAGTLKVKGERKTSYINVCINGRLYLAHRIVWLLINGSFPDNQIDHINGDGLDNRIENLRDVTPKENSNNPVTIEKTKRLLSRRCPTKRSNNVSIYYHKRDKVFIVKRILMGDRKERRFKSSFDAGCFYRKIQMEIKNTRPNQA